MELAELIGGLSRPEAHPGVEGPVTVAQTHVSVVFLAGDVAWKIKKPVDLGFLDFSTLEKRRLACEAEVRVNRRLAPKAYLGVVPVTRGPDGLRFGGDGEIVEHAVKMRRLPDDATLAARLASGTLDADTLRCVACRLAAFHASAERGPRISEAASFAAWSRVVRENLEQVRPFVGRPVSAELLDRLIDETERALAGVASLVDARIPLACDTHGDLRLEHVYVLDEPEPDDVVVLDGIEFDERLRFADPVSDAAFLVMDLEFAHRPDLAEAFFGAWVEARKDADARRLLPLHVAYRHVVRGKVRSIEADEPEVLPSEREHAAARATPHFVAALDRIAGAARRPALLLMGGLAGVGKSTLAKELERRAGFVRLSSDETRKRLAGLDAHSSATAAFGEGLYTPESTRRTYDELAGEARATLERGGRAVVDASFHEDARRQAFLDLATRLRTPAVFVELRADAPVARARLAARSGDPSDADLAVHVEMARRWEPAADEVRPFHRVVDASGSREEAWQRLLDVLRAEGLAGPDVDSR